MLCKIPIKSSGETHSNIGKRMTKYACVVDADEYSRPRLEGAVDKHHQYHITAKGMKTKTHYSVVHRFLPMPHALKKLDANTAVEKNGKNGENTGMAADESQRQERSDRRSKG